MAFEVGGRPGLGVPSRGVEYGWLVVGRVERGAFASGLSGFGVVPVHPPLPLRGADPAPFARAKPKKLPARRSPLETDKFRMSVVAVAAPDFRHAARS